MPTNLCRKPIWICFLILAFSAAGAAAAGTSLSGKRILVIDKARKDLVVFIDGRRVARFPASFGIDPDSDKRRAFDCATPEGLYFITHKKVHRRYHRLLGLSYPNPAKAEKALSEGVISQKEYTRLREAFQKLRPSPCKTGLGCGIAIHGGGVFKGSGMSRERDWTRGCIALDNPDMERLFDFCTPGDPVVIFNSRKNLYGLVRPFARLKDLDENDTPRCPGGVFTYQAEFPTRLGRTAVTIQEGKTYGRSLAAVVLAAEDPEKPILVLVDRNADGRLSPVDSATGLLAEKRPPRRRL